LAYPDVRGRYSLWQNLNANGFLPQNTTTNIFFVTDTDFESYRVEATDPSVIQAEIMEVLAQMFPHKKIPQPTAFYYPLWHTNPLYYGSYSNWPIGELDQHHHNMRAPLANNHLFFTGEAMSADYFGFLQGAWIDGNETGANVARCINNNCVSYPFYKDIVTCPEVQSGTAPGKQPETADETAVQALSLTQSTNPQSQFNTVGVVIGVCVAVVVVIAIVVVFVIFIKKKNQS